MKKSFDKLIAGYQHFRDKYAKGQASVMSQLSDHGQKPEIMVVSCCDSRVDPALILQCDPGDLFVIRNVANIIPPYEKDDTHHGTSAALEFGICFLKVKHLIILGHSQCAGIQTLMNQKKLDNDFISKWVSIINLKVEEKEFNANECGKVALTQSYRNCLTFPWLKEKVVQQKLFIHLWFFDIKEGKIFTYCEKKKLYQPLD